MGHCLLLHPTQDGERETLQAGGVWMPHIHSLWVQAIAELGTAARAARGLTNCFKPCEGQLLPTSIHSVLHLLDFESASDLLHPYCLVLSMPPKSSSFQASEGFYLGISLPALCHSCSLADECLRWGGCWLAVEEWPWTGAWHGGVGSSVCPKACTAELQRGTKISKIHWERNEKEGEIKPQGRGVSVH